MLKMIEENVSTLKIHKMSQEQYNREFEAGRIDDTALYLTFGEENRTHYTSNTNVTITWDGNTEGLEGCVDDSRNIYYKVSDISVQPIDPPNGEICFDDQRCANVSSINKGNWEDGYSILKVGDSGRVVFVFRENNNLHKNIEITDGMEPSDLVGVSTGVYFGETVRSVSCKVETVTTLHEKYIPDTIARTSDIPPIDTTLSVSGRVADAKATGDAIKSHQHSASAITSGTLSSDRLPTVPVNKGGTGATTVAGARNALGLGNTTGALPIANGGTGATNAATARSNLGITPANIGAATSDHTHDTKYLRRYDINSINIDNTNYCWTVDISEQGHGTIPETSINVTQFTSGHFFIQMAVTCQSSSNTTRNVGSVWMRNKYVNGAWSKWTKLAFA